MRLTSALLLVLVGGVIGYSVSYRYYGSFIRGWDGQMYYAQLRSAVIDGDLDFDNELTSLTLRPQTFRDASGRSLIPRTVDGRVANKYTAGWAVVTAPPFVATHLLYKPFHRIATGYSTSYQIAVTSWHLLLLLISIALLATSVARITHADAAAVAVIGAFFATNVVYYACVYPIMNHAASFSVIASLVFIAIRLYEDEGGTRGWWIAAACLAMLLVLLRPTDVMFLLVLVPAMWMRWRRSPSHCVAPVLVPLAVVAAAVTQLIVWRFSYQYWISNTYASEISFAWLAPQFANTLLSSDRGAWFFHPYHAVGTLGLVVMASSTREPRRWIWVSMLVAYGLHVYVQSCYVTANGNGHSFGNRMFANSAPLALAGVSGLYGRLHRRGRITLAGLVAVLVFCNALLSIAYVQGRIPPAGSVSLRQIWQAGAAVLSQLGSRLLA